MSYQKICSRDDLWEGEMQVFEAGGKEILLVSLEGGAVRAFDPICPHQEQALIEGVFDDGIITCPAHLWQFDADTGLSVNPEGCEMHSYPVRVEGEIILVDLPD
jgi:toluene monooxygenase system ferredoxin subunit